MAMYHDRVKMDCNWLVIEVAKDRQTLRDLMLEGVVGIEARTLIKVDIRNMDHKEVCAKIKELRAAK